MFLTNNYFDEIMSLKLSNIHKSYGNQEVLRGISFEVYPGEIAGFLGRNGAGKSTCMKIITGGILADEGDVIICGYDIRTNLLEGKRRMGYLPENNPLYPEMYVREYLCYIAGIYGLCNAGETVDAMMELVHLTEVGGKTIGTLSKGYRQRVGLAQALLHNPDVLILDEPFSGLDPNQLEEMHMLLHELGKNKAILFSSHALREAGALCDRILILHNGLLVADNSIEDLTRDISLEDKFKELTK